MLHKKGVPQKGTTITTIIRAKTHLIKETKSDRVIRKEKRVL